MGNEDARSARKTWHFSIRFGTSGVDLYEVHSRRVAALLVAQRFKTLVQTAVPAAIAFSVEITVDQMTNGAE